LCFDDDDDFHARIFVLRRRKTGAFAIPILQSMRESGHIRGPYAVILSPTRELAVQIEKVFKALCSKIGDVTCCCVIGGMSCVSLFF
jgi:ATP-dependent RNA helicase DeaD